MLCGYDRREAAKFALCGERIKSVGGLPEKIHLPHTNAMCGQLRKEKNLKKTNLTVIDGETLMDKRLAPTRFCVETLLPQGLCILGGAPKVGKSWLVLDLCIHIARGEPLWGLPVTQGETLYLCLEDSERRIQERLNLITDDVPSGLYFATGSTSIESGVCDWIRKFRQEHPAVTFVVIDTFQLIRTPTADVSYSNDYAELQPLRALAEELKICLLLLHHLRKMGDKDPINKLSGSTGIAGAVDAIYVLEKNERTENGATLYVSGRDIRDRKIKLEMESTTCTWRLISDSLVTPETNLSDELEALTDFVKEVGRFKGRNIELAEAVSAILCRQVTANGLKRLMNLERARLETVGVFFESRRSNGERLIHVWYTTQNIPKSDASDDSDAIPAAADFIVPVVPCDSDETKLYV